MRKFKSITFFYPSKVVGGAEFLFIRLAKILFTKYHFDVNYIDFEDGFARELLNSDCPGINFINFYNYGKIQLPVDTIVITPLSSTIDVLRYFRADSRILLLFWSIQPLGLKNTLSYYFGLSKSKDHAHPSYYKQSLELMSALNALYFMDGPNFYIQKEIFNYGIADPKYLPIPCQISDSVRNQKIVDKAHVNIGWLGRLSNEKIFSLINILDHANFFVASGKGDLTIHIIGEGEAPINIKNYPQLNIVFLGSLIGDDLRHYLENNIDLLFAMGTSALEGAVLRLPTILVDFSYSPIPITNSFRWLYESETFSLGDLYTSENKQSHTFNELLTTINTDVFYKQGDRCYDYVKENHDIDKVALALTVALNQTRMSVLDLSKSDFNKFKFTIRIVTLKNYLKHLWKKY